MATVSQNFIFTKIQSEKLHLYIHDSEANPTYCILSDVIWDQFIGQWQKEIKDTSKEFDIHIHLEKCRWVDPLPALSILIEISVILEKFTNVYIHLQGFDEESIFSILRNSNNGFSRSFLRKYKFLRFLADQKIIEGWLKKGAIVLFDSKQANPTSDNISKNIIDITSRFLRSYANSDLVPVQVVEVPFINKNEEFPGNYTDQLLNEIEVQLNTDLPISATDKVLYKLKLILQECIHNVQEHAYGLEDSRYIGIYIRFRTGGEGISDSVNKRIFKHNIKEESKRSPKLDNGWIDCREGAIEFFVIDRGKGIINSFQEVGLFRKRPLTLQKIILDTFDNGLSSKRERFSAKGGLHLINSVSTGDYLRAFCGDTWIGTPFPVVRNQAQIHEKNQAKEEFKGFALHFRLGWKNLTDKGNSWFNIGGTKESHKQSLNKILSEEYGVVKRIIEPFSYAIIDERFKDLTQLDVSEITDSVKSNGVLLWLVKPGRMKWDIFTFLERYIQGGIRDKNIKLIIADIDSHEASTYEAAFSGANLEKRNLAVTWQFDISEIILVSQRWLFARLNRRFLDRKKVPLDKALNIAEVVSVQYSSINNEDVVLEDHAGTNGITLRKLAIYLCKLHDSNLFWSYIDQQVNQNLFINKTIKWNADIPRMNGYLNFSNAVRVPSIYKLLKLNLSKYIAGIRLTSGEGGAIISLDRLVYTLVEDIKASKSIHEKNVTGDNHNDLSVGSVYVSGSTKSASQPTLDTIHFFMHPDTVSDESNINHLLYWLKSNEDCQSDDKFERVGRTSAIAPNGWKSLEIPRYSDGKIDGQRTPTETYLDIQSLRPIISKTGHWHYEGQHDFLTFNLKDSIEDAFAKSQTSNNNLFLFLVNTFFGYLNIDIENCIKEEYIEIVKEAIADKNIKSFDKKGIVVYRSHLVNELIISKLLELVVPAARGDVLSKIFPIIPLRQRWNGSAFIISPMDSQTMKEALLKLPHSEQNVLIFDDAAITGRTLLDITSTMLSVGAINVDVAVILNRMRSPSLKSSSGQMQYYWRVDVPPIGREGSCPLCHAVETLNVFKNKLCVDYYVQMVADWTEFWKKATPISEWHRGLKPLPLSNTNYKKNYCFDPNQSKHRDKIHITRTNGLITHVSELHAMTGADDYVIDRIEKIENGIDESTEIKVELISSQLLLFCSEYDYKETFVLLKKLINYLGLLDKDSTYTGLAFIALISGIEVLNRNSKVEFVKKLVSETESQYFVDTETKTLFKAFLISHELLNGKDYISSEQVLKSDGLEFSLLIREVHASILSPSGNKHSRPLTRFIDRLETDVTDEFKTYLNTSLWTVKNHLSRLISILETIGLSNARYLINENVQDIYLNVKNTISNCLEMLNEDINDNNRIALTKQCSQVINDIVKYLKFYVQIIPITQPNPLQNVKKSMEMLLDRVKDRGIEKGIKLTYGRNSTVFTPSIRTNCWVIWTADVEQIIEDLICNSAHVKLVSTSDEGESGEEKHLWVNFSLDNSGLKLIIANKITANFNVKDTFELLSVKRRWASLENYGGKVELIDTEHPQEMKIGLTIPFVHKLTGSVK